jgi:hypothetical protein
MKENKGEEGKEKGEENRKREDGGGGKEEGEGRKGGRREEEGGRREEAYQVLSHKVLSPSGNQVSTRQPSELF